MCQVSLDSFDLWTAHHLHPPLKGEGKRAPFATEGGPGWGDSGASFAAPRLQYGCHPLTAASRPTSPFQGEVEQEPTPGKHASLIRGSSLARKSGRCCACVTHDSFVGSVPFKVYRRNRRLPPWCSFQVSARAFPDEHAPLHHWRGRAGTRTGHRCSTSRWD